MLSLPGAFVLMIELTQADGQPEGTLDAGGICIAAPRMDGPQYDGTWTNLPKSGWPPVLGAPHAMFGLAVSCNFAVNCAGRHNQQSRGKTLSSGDGKPPGHLSVGDGSRHFAGASRRTHSRALSGPSYRVRRFPHRCASRRIFSPGRNASSCDNQVL